jgi:hypothetical protein
MEIESQEKMDATRGATLDAKTIEQLGLGWEKRSKDHAGLVARRFSPRCAGFSHAGSAGTSMLPGMVCNQPRV